ncbi:Epidermal patterning factor-like protein [Quillaja saponaria]|uniref:Epidermal patterning factor-like protein n=1 Tax=Quillaja saponaria TaxID=32244 RepID=A0AAD7LVR2_QUISA|nr:Epidermal patterning factor-like protein [Quillaja saponaria]
MEKKRSRTRLKNKTPFLYTLSFFFFLSFILFCTIGFTTSTCVDKDSRCPFFSEAVTIDFQDQGMESSMASNSESKCIEVSHGLARRFLGGLGSSPPRCASKCGKCTPCKPVHVPVPPGTPVTAEYYPEAWRCKCGNKLYMP